VHHPTLLSPPSRPYFRLITTSQLIAEINISTSQQCKTYSSCIKFIQVYITRSCRNKYQHKQYKIRQNHDTGQGGLNIRFLVLNFIQVWIHVADQCDFTKLNSDPWDPIMCTASSMDEMELRWVDWASIQVPDAYFAFQISLTRAHVLY
jgi:hypothetical protein